MSEGIIELTDKNFKSNIEKGIILVDFWASWCAPCHMIAPIVEEVAKEYKDKIRVGKLNVDANQLTAADLE
ncbi:MAG: thioredoxin domain-containing protein [Candidatus Omnitrophota bacterium]